MCSPCQLGWAPHWAPSHHKPNKSTNMALETPRRGVQLKHHHQCELRAKGGGWVSICSSVKWG